VEDGEIVRKTWTKRIVSKMFYVDDIDRWRYSDFGIQRPAVDRFGTQKERNFGYFVDQFGFERYIAKDEVEPENKTPGNSPVKSRLEYIAILENFLSGVDEIGLRKILPNDPIPSMPVLASLLHKWRAYLELQQIPLPETAFCDPAGKRWHDFFANSVHYPSRPAISGPTFFARVTATQKRKILENGGVEGVLARYAFLNQSHEEMHTYQTGEPLLCEVFLSILWTGFLTETGEWYWQRNEETGESFNMEYPVFKNVMERSCIRYEGSLDCFEIVRSSCIRGVDHRTVYEDLLSLAWNFRRGRIRYMEYLSRVSKIFEVSFAN
jgi:hypothetical protein